MFSDNHRSACSCGDLLLSAPALIVSARATSGPVKTGPPPPSCRLSKMLSSFFAVCFRLPSVSSAEAVATANTEKTAIPRRGRISFIMYCYPMHAPAAASNNWPPFCFNVCLSVFVARASRWSRGRIIASRYLRIRSLLSRSQLLAISRAALSRQYHHVRRDRRRVHKRSPS